MDATLAVAASILQYWPLALIVPTVIIGVVLIVRLLQTLLNRSYLHHRSLMWLEITPPLTVTKTPEATAQLFSVIHGLRATRSRKDKLLRRLPTLSCEIVSTRQAGIRYLIQLESSQQSFVQAAIAAYIPHAKVKEVTAPAAAFDRVVEYRETNHYILPLTLTSPSEKHDPLSYITSAMTRLEDSEVIVLQLVMTPIVRHDATTLSHRIFNNENILRSAMNRQHGGVRRLLNGIGDASFGLLTLVGDVSTSVLSNARPSSRGTHVASSPQLPSARPDRPARSLSTFEQELMETMHKKVTQPLFQVNLRVLVKSPHTKRHSNTVTSALGGFSVPPYQSLNAYSRLSLFNRRRHHLGEQRLPSILARSSVILAATELASLYHIPSYQISQTDNLIATLSRTLPAPVSLKSHRSHAVLIGENHHHNVITPIGLTAEERERHQYIIGGTGNGKTTMLFYQILQDIRAGNGVTVIDPHGDLAERILRFIPEQRINDVIYLNPDDLSHPIGMNLLELSPKLKGDDLLREKDLVTEATISVMRKLFSDTDAGGHRVEYILRNAVQTALTLQDPTLFTVFELLNDGKFRQSAIGKLHDKNLKDFWNNEFGKAGSMQQVKMAAGITAKIGRFLFSASARRMLEQPTSTINFEDILTHRKLLICNFSKGLLGEDASALFGTTVLAKLQTASLQRARIKETNRTPHYLYVDEFQNFATTSFVQMLSEARKYKLFLTMAEQSTAQQDEQRLVNIILANVGTVVCFRSGSPADEQLVLPLFHPFIQQGEITNLSSYSYYVRISAVSSQEPMSGATVVIQDHGDEAMAARVIKASRQHYAITIRPNKSQTKAASTDRQKEITEEKKHTEIPH